MISIKVLAAFCFGFFFLLLGFFDPRLMLLDAPFGLGYFLVESLGLWRSGPMWIVENRLLAILCFFGSPLMMSGLFGYGTAEIVFRLAGERNRRSNLYAVIFVVALFGLILSVRVEPGTYLDVSYFGHWASNY